MLLKAFLCLPLKSWLFGVMVMTPDYELAGSNTGLFVFRKNGLV